MKSEIRRPKHEQREHDRQIGSFAHALEAGGHQIVATVVESPNEMPRFDGELPGCESPHCRIPDIYALDERGQPVIAEVETESSLSWPRTRCQLSLFSGHGRTIVLVPWPYRPLMERRLREWGVAQVEVRPY